MGDLNDSCVLLIEVYCVLGYFFDVCKFYWFFCFNECLRVMDY